MSLCRQSFTIPLNKFSSLFPPLQCFARAIKYHHTSRRRAVTPSSSRILDGYIKIIIISLICLSSMHRVLRFANHSTNGYICVLMITTTTATTTTMLMAIFFLCLFVDFNIRTHFYWMRFVELNESQLTVVACNCTLRCRVTLH